MLNFQGLRGYPMLHIPGPLDNGHITYQFTHTEEPVEGEEAVTMRSQGQPGTPNAVLVSLDRIEPAKSPHHPVPVMLYTATFKLLPIHN